MHKFDSHIHHRRSIRLKDYDYSQPGAYFVTICMKGKECLFGEINGGIMILNDSGRMVEMVWNELPLRHLGVEIDAFVVMPNHFHGIIVLNGQTKKGQPQGLPLQDHRVGVPLVGTQSVPALGDIVGAFKSVSTDEYITGVNQSGWPVFDGKLWQRNYYEHVIRNEESLEEIREYTVYNPLKWDEDSENPSFNSGKKLT